MLMIEELSMNWAMSNISWTMIWWSSVQW